MLCVIENGANDFYGKQFYFKCIKENELNGYRNCDKNLLYNVIF